MVAVTLALALKCSAASVDRFDYVIGTQTFSPAYQFTEKPCLVETAEAIQEMGANVLKFELSRRYGRKNGNVPERNPNIHSLAELARDEPAHRRVLDMPLANFVIWAHLQQRSRCELAHRSPQIGPGKGIPRGVSPDLGERPEKSLSNRRF
jgi:hypothetical protein